MTSKTGLIIIDVQQGFDDSSYWGERNNPEAEQKMHDILVAFRAAELPIFHVRHDSTSKKSPLHPSNPGNRIKPEVAPAEGEPVYPKTVNSAFIGTDLERDIRAKGVERLVIVGLTTNHCVSTTTRMAGNFGFDTAIVSDATATFERMGLDGKMRPAEEVHASALSDLNEEFARVIDTQSVLEELRSN